MVTVNETRHVSFSTSYVKFERFRFDFKIVVAIFISPKLGSSQARTLEFFQGGGAKPSKQQI